MAAGHGGTRCAIAEQDFSGSCNRDTRERLPEIFQQRQRKQTVTSDVRFGTTATAQKERGAMKKINVVESRNGTRIRLANPNREGPRAPIAGRLASPVSATPRLTPERTSRIMRPWLSPRLCDESRAIRQRVVTFININFRMRDRRNAMRRTETSSFTTSRRTVRRCSP